MTAWLAPEQADQAHKNHWSIDRAPPAHLRNRTVAPSSRAGSQGGPPPACEGVHCHAGACGADELTHMENSFGSS